MVKGIFFDFYGTLYVLGDMKAELEEWITELHSLLIEKGSYSTRDEVFRYYNQRMWNDDYTKPIESRTIFETRILKACTDLGASMTHYESSLAAEKLLEVWDRYTCLDPFCIPVLDSIKKRKKVTVLISNYDHPQHIHELVKNTGMKDYFSAVIVSGDVGCKKPQRAIFEIALNQVNMEPSEIAYIGDSEEDVLGANNAGIISVLIDRNSHGRNYGQQFTIRNLQDILDLFP